MDVSLAFVTIFTLQTRVPAFQRGGGLMAVRWGERNDEDDAAHGWAGSRGIGRHGIAGATRDEFYVPGGRARPGADRIRGKASLDWPCGRRSRALRLASPAPAARKCCLTLRMKSGQKLLTKLQASGRSPAHTLTALRFFDDGAAPQCQDGAVTAFTHPGSQVIRVCGRQFTDRGRTAAEIIVIHEFLHALGLGENPPTSRDITERVAARCGTDAESANHPPLRPDLVPSHSGGSRARYAAGSNVYWRRLAPGLTTPGPGCIFNVDTWRRARKSRSGATVWVFACPNRSRSKRRSMRGIPSTCR
jgi:hypothetical protein